MLFVQKPKLENKTYALIFHVRPIQPLPPVDIFKNHQKRGQKIVGFSKPFRITKNISQRVTLVVVFGRHFNLTGLFLPLQVIFRSIITFSAYGYLPKKIYFQTLRAGIL